MGYLKKNLTNEETMIMNKIFKQAEPKVYSPVKIDDDYIGRLRRNEVSQPEPNIGKLTDSLYSSMKPVKAKSSFYNIPKKLTPTYHPNKQDSSYSSQESNY